MVPSSDSVPVRYVNNLKVELATLISHQHVITPRSFIYKLLVVHAIKLWDVAKHHVISTKAKRILSQHTIES